MSPRLVSLNLSLPYEVVWRNRRVRTAFHKKPVEGAVALGPEGFVGDQVGDPTVHGGPRKAVYAYPTAHYDYWRHELRRDDLPWGSFGENLSVGGMTEGDIRVGDRLAVGGALLEVTKPRTPCYKLNVRFDRDDMVRRFAESGWSGFYLGVIRPGLVQAGDEIRILATGEPRPTVLELFRTAMHGPIDPASELADD